MNPVLNEMLSRKAGCDITTSQGAQYLRGDIKRVTGESVGLNTIKRLIGSIPYEGTHRSTILEIISRYLGFGSWTLLEAKIKDEISGFDRHSSIVELEGLPTGQKIAVEWEPDRRIVMKHQEGKLYTVEESVNSKLERGDRMTLSQIAAGFPLYANDVIRDGKSLGNYTAAVGAGIKKIEML